MADSSGISPYIFPLRGGLVLNRSNFDVEPGMAVELQNFEPDTGGGYRRIDGYTKWGGSKVPFTSSDAEPILMSAFFQGEVVAARGEGVYRSTGASTILVGGGLGQADTTVTVASSEGFSETGTLFIGLEQINYTGKTGSTFTGCVRGVNGTIADSHLEGFVVNQTWTEIDSGRTGANRYNHRRVNFNGSEILVFVDGSNNASYWDGASLTDITGSLAPADPQHVALFKNTGFYAGMSLNPQEIIFTAPLTLDDFSTANGAGSFVVDSPVTGMINFRDTLYIFSTDRIYRLSGNSQADFRLDPVSRGIGCRNGWTIKELGGDIVFLGPDGLRTIAGTERIGDVDLGTISRPVQSLFQNRVEVDQFISYIIPNKTQYRILFNKEGVPPSATDGVICSLDEDGYEFATTRGIRMYSSDTEEYRGAFYIILGGYDGYIYRDQQGNTFDGEHIIGRYRSPDITAGDAGIRKSFQRVIINYAPEGVVNSDLYIRYDYESGAAPRPAAYPFDSSQVVALYGLGVYGLSTYGGQSNPLVRQPIEGSGFSIALRVVDNGLSTPYSLKGFQLEFTTAARR